MEVVSAATGVDTAGCAVTAAEFVSVDVWACEWSNSYNFCSMAARAAAISEAVATGATVGVVVAVASVAETVLVEVSAIGASVAGVAAAEV